jgi:ParB-like chromosome segregation protein Spo0J
LKPYPDNPRQHPEAQIAGLMKSIRRVWTIPILIDETGTILAGHGWLEAAKRLNMSEVPTVTVAGLSPAEKRAIVIADNRLPERAVWDFELPRGHFQNLVEVNFDIELTGFSTGEVRMRSRGQPTWLLPESVQHVIWFMLWVALRFRQAHVFGRTPDSNAMNKRSVAGA